jgi:hypothetical protein
MVTYRCAKGATLRMPYVVTITDGGSYTVNRCVMRERAIDRLTGASITLTTEDRAADASVPAGFNAVVSAAASDAIPFGEADTVEYQVDAFLNIGSDIIETEPALIVFYRAASSNL